MLGKDTGKILCPFCFNEINVKKIYYRCSSASCHQKDEKGMVVLARNGKPERHIILYPKAKDGFCECDICGGTTSTKVCSECLSDLPYNILESETKIISIVGAKHSGKSYYVATLLRQIMNNGILDKTMKEVACGWGTTENKLEYERRYGKNLDERRILAGTDPTDNLIKDNPPILLEITGTIRKKRCSSTFSFFDAAGESFEDANSLAAITPYLGHSLAIIIILDPRQIPSLQNAFNDLGYTGEASKESYSYILDNTKKVLRNVLRIRKDSEKIKIPLCIAISKWDLVRKVPGLLADGMIVGQNTGVSTVYDQNMIDVTSNEIRSLILEWESNLVRMAESNFETVKYFGFSAWGFSDAEAGSAPVIASYKVEDPILWVLNNVKL